jgi:hypothetical protein
MFSSGSVGRGSALISSLATVSGLAQLNYARSLSALLPSAARPRKLLGGVYGLTGLLSLTFGLGSALLIPQVTGQFTYLRGDLAFMGGFACAVSFWTVFTLEDTALTSVRRATIVPFENGAYGLLKLLCLYLLWRVGDRSGQAIFLSWVLPLVALIVPINLFLFTRAVPTSNPVQTAPVTPKVRAPAWIRYDFAGYLLWLLGTLPLPLLVLLTAGAARTASFYVPFTIAASIDLLSLNLGNSLTAELARARNTISRPARTFIARVIAGVVILSGLLFILAPFVLQVFGGSYRSGGAIILRVLMLAALPRSVMFVGIAIQRARNNGPAILVTQGIAAIGTLCLGLPLTRVMGPVGTSIGWLVASSVSALVTLLLLGANRRGSHRSASGSPEPLTLRPPANGHHGAHRARRVSTFTFQAEDGTK